MAPSKGRHHLETDACTLDNTQLSRGNTFFKLYIIHPSHLPQHLLPYLPAVTIHVA